MFSFFAETGEYSRLNIMYGVDGYFVMLQYYFITDLHRSGGLHFDRWASKKIEKQRTGDTPFPGQVWYRFFHGDTIFSSSERPLLRRRRTDFLPFNSLKKGTEVEGRKRRRPNARGTRVWNRILCRNERAVLFPINGRLFFFLSVANNNLHRSLLFCFILFIHQTV